MGDNRSVFPGNKDNLLRNQFNHLRFHLNPVE